MFKSGKSLSFNARTVRSNGSVLVAPKINFNSVVLSASSPIPKEIVEFFTAKGAKIDQISEDGDKFVRLSGKFVISKAEIEAFLAKHKDLQVEGLRIQVETPLPGKKPKIEPKINVTGEFTNTNGSTILLESMNLAGLYLDPNEPLTEEVIAFFKSKGATIELITQDGQKFIKLTGRFTIKKADVEQFLKQQSDRKQTAEAQDIKAEAEAEAHNFQKQMRARIKAIQSNFRTNVSVQHTLLLEQEVRARNKAKTVISSELTPVMSFRPPTLLSSEGQVQISVTNGSFSANTATIISKTDTIIKTGTTITLDSVCNAQLKTGMLSELTAGEDASFQSGSETTIKNAVVLASKDIIFSTPEHDVTLTFERDSAWMNPSFIPSFVFAYEEDEDVGAKGKKAGAKARI